MKLQGSKTNERLYFVQLKCCVGLGLFCGLFLLNSKCTNKQPVLQVVLAKGAKDDQVRNEICCKFLCAIAHTKFGGLILQ
jgi:hypothetical protein